MTRKMRLGFYCLLVIICSAFLGCYAMGPKNADMYSRGQFTDLAKYQEERLKTTSNPVEWYYLCESYSNLKQYNKLFQCLDNLENSIRSSSIDYVYSMNPYMLRALAYTELGEYDKALTEARKDFKQPAQVGADGQMVKSINQVKKLSLLTTIYILKNDRERAAATLKTLETFDLPVYGWGRVRFEKRNGLAKGYMGLGDYNKALSNLQEEGGMAALNAVLSPLANIVLSGNQPFAEERYDSYLQVPRLFMLNKALFETGQLEKAKEGYEELLKKAQISSNGEIYWMTLYDRGRIAEKEGNLKEAAGFYQKAIEVIEQQRSTINTEVNKIGFVTNKQDVYHRLIRVFYNQNEFGRAFEYVERSKSRALVDLLASVKDFAIKGDNEKDIKIDLALNEENEINSVSQDVTVDKAKTRSSLVKSNQDLRAKAPELASLVSVTSYPIQELSKLIPPDEMLIEYYYHREDMYVFVLSRKGMIQAAKIDNNNLEADIRKFRRDLESPRSSNSSVLSQKLYKTLFEPINKYITVSKLTIIPHGALHYLPVNILSDGNKYIIDRFSIRVMPSASAIKYIGDKKSDRKTGALIFGNPDLGNPSDDLVYAEKEAKNISSIIPASKLLVRKEATETALRSFGGSYKYIHFATHGQFNPISPLNSALLLSPDTRSNGILTVGKLYSLRLDSDLVTLSACETGLSRTASGDDLVGLTRGFLYAGCKGIIASLWRVDDEATAYLMVRFYKELDKNNKREALRIAQLDAKKKYNHPFYWASFQITGNDN